MVRLTKIYTRTGDGGQTRLVGGQQVPKDSLRIEAYGSVDELNAVLGLCRAHLEREPGLAEADRARLKTWIHDVQQRLFDLGSDLATLAEDRFEGQPVTTHAHVTALERFIDALNADLEPLRSFVLPGGGPLTAHTHQARTVCRRVERRVLALSRSEPVGDQVIPYLNRLSDALFVLGRWIAKRTGEGEILWEIKGS